MPETEPWRKELQERAEAYLSRFVAENPACSMDEDQPEDRGGTHLITYGSFQGRYSRDA